MMRCRRKLCLIPLALVLVIGAAVLVTWTTQNALEESHGRLALPSHNRTARSGITEETLRIVHLDLKGAPPRMHFLHDLLVLMATRGVNALLIEYEDTFPYTGRLANLSAVNAYSRQQVKQILSWAHDLYMEVIPLVQTFGHLEMALKLQEFKHLRELDSFPMELCPSKDDSLKLVEEIISQVMEVHTQSKYLHIGCDEVYHIAACPLCSQRSAVDLYSDHVVAVAEAVRSRWGVTPLIWDDIVRQWPLQQLVSSPLGSIVEPVVWAYATEVSTLIPRHTWHWYCKTFPRIWVAGAFKGASGPTAVLPTLWNHYQNMKSWMNYVAEYTPTPVGGVILTGWSRFDHFGGLCELMAASVPSLLLSLAAVCDGPTSVDPLQAWTTSMQCPDGMKAENMNAKDIMECRFLGLTVYSKMNDFILLRNEVNNAVKKVESSGWITNYHLNHNVSNPFRLVEILTDLQSGLLGRQTDDYRKTTRNALLRYYGEDTVDEWTEQNVDALIKKLEKAVGSVQKLLARNIWPRRPYN